MRIRQKYYPYPVMERVGRSYKEFSFNVTTNVKREGYNIVFEFTAEIADEKISNLIKHRILRIDIVNHTSISHLSPLKNNHSI